MVKRRDGYWASRAWGEGQGIPSEAQEQERVVLWWRLYSSEVCIHPQLLWHTPNGGGRDAAEGAHFKRLGVVAGVPDLFLAVPMGPWHGLFVEMKRRSAKSCATAAQRLQMRLLERRGYYCLVAKGADAAILAITAYLDGHPPLLHEGETVEGLQRVREEEL